MKVYHVSDNRTGANWGGRATSIALAGCIAAEHRIVGTLYNAVKKRVARLDCLAGGAEEAATGLQAAAGADPELRAMLDGIAACDAVVVNGEGDMIFTRSRRTLTFLLATMRIARAQGKPVFFVNAMVSDCPVDGRSERVLRQCLEGLRQCAGVALRDPLSMRLLAELAPDIPARLVPDALFQWIDAMRPERLFVRQDGNIILPYPHDGAFGRFDFSGDYLCLAGTSRVKSQQAETAIEFFTDLATRLVALGLPVYLVETSPGDRFLRVVAARTGLPLVPIETPIVLAAQVLAGARLLVSGRYHPSVMASLGGTPFVGLVSNSHKMPGLQRLLGYDTEEEFPLAHDAANLQAIVGRAQRLLERGDALRRDLLAAARSAADASRAGLHQVLSTPTP